MNSNDKSPTTKNLYLIDYWLSDGLLILIAENDPEAMQILMDEEGLYIEDGEGSKEQFTKNVISAQKFRLTDDYESGIIEVFCP